MVIVGIHPFLMGSKYRSQTGMLLLIHKHNMSWVKTSGKNVNISRKGSRYASTYMSNISSRFKRSPL